MNLNKITDCTSIRAKGTFSSRQNGYSVFAHSACVCYHYLFLSPQLCTLFFTKLVKVPSYAHRKNLLVVLVFLLGSCLAIEGVYLQCLAIL